MFAAVRFWNELRRHMTLRLNRPHRVFFQSSEESSFQSFLSPTFCSACAVISYLVGVFEMTLQAAGGVKVLQNGVTVHHMFHRRLKIAPKMASSPNYGLSCHRNLKQTGKKAYILLDVNESRVRQTVGIFVEAVHVLSL